MKLEKTNYAKVGKPIALMWLEGRLTRTSNTGNATFLNAAKEQYLYLLEYHMQRGIDVSPKPCKTFAPKVFSDHSKAGDYTSTVFHQAQIALLEENMIEIVSVGPSSKKRDRIRLPTSSQPISIV